MNKVQTETILRMPTEVGSNSLMIVTEEDDVNMESITYIRVDYHDFVTRQVTTI